MNYKIALLCCLILSACSKDRNYANIDVIGHAGYGLTTTKSLYQSNTAESIEMALGTAGCNGVEVDVQLTADGELILFHDEDLDDFTSLEGCVNNLSLAELLAGHYTSFHQEKLLPLKNLNTTYLENKTVYLDIRHYNACSGEFVDEDLFIAKLKEVIATFPASTRYYAFLLDNDWAEGFAAADIPVMLQAGSYDGFLKEHEAHPLACGLVIRNAAISKSEVAAIRKLGQKVVIFEVRSAAATKKAFSKLPDAVITDDLVSGITLKN